MVRRCWRSTCSTFSGDLYGAPLDVAFIGWIRAELKFDSVDALVVRMNEDARLARAALARTPAFPVLGDLRLAPDREKRAKRDECKARRDSERGHVRRPLRDECHDHRRNRRHEQCRPCDAPDEPPCSRPDRTARAERHRARW